MGFQPHLIADFKTALETDKQPWLIPDDAQEEIFDAYVNHGVIHKRDGYEFLANGQRGGAPYTESRLVRRVTSEAFAVGDGGATYGPFILANIPLRRGTVQIIDTVGGQTANDDGVGGFVAPHSGSVNYYTGSVTITFQNPVGVGNPIVATYDYHPGNPIMMIAIFVTANNVKQLLIADTQFLNRYNASTNRFDDITTRVFTGDHHDFFTWIQYPTILDQPRLLFTNNVDQIQSYDGITSTDWYPTFSSTAVSGEIFGSGNGTTGPYSHTALSPPIRPTSVVIMDDSVPPQVVMDDGAGHLNIGNGTGTVDYTSGAMVVTFTNPVAAVANNITVSYDTATGYVVTCLKMVDFKDRLLLFRTTEVGGVVHPRRIRISGTGQSGDDFRTTATGAGLIDIPSQYWIDGVDYNRDDVMPFTERETWILKFTSNDVVPFTLEKIDGSRGNKAPFATISYLNFTKAYSQYGFVVTDGYQVQRYDDRIPDYSFENIDQDNFDLCFSGAVEDDQNHYLIHPSPGRTTSNQILVNNYEENNFSVFRLPLSCMGNFFEAFDIIWDDLSEANGFPDWDAFAQKYATWNDIGYSKDQPITLGGGHKGEIWRLNADTGEDNPLRIWGITQISIDPLVVEVTLDHHNYILGDFVFFSGITETDVVNEVFGSGVGTVGPYQYTALNKRIIPTTVNIVADPGGTPQTVTDDGNGNLVGDGTGTVNYSTGMFTVTFNAVVPVAANNIELDYSYIYELNGKQGSVTTVVDDNTIRVTFEDENPQTISTFTSGGTISRTIPFEFITKNFNPFSGQDQKVRCGWMYLYVDTAETIMTDLLGNQLPAKIQIEVFSDDNEVPTQVTTANLKYEGNTTNFDGRISNKVWRKIYINQSARFVQFRIKNTQPGTRIRIHALMPGFSPVGRLI